MNQFIIPICFFKNKKCFLFNEIFFLQLTLFVIIIFIYFSVTTLYTLYLGGLFLITLGFYLYINNLDIFVGFLWVIDFGIGLIFFIFILNLTIFFKNNIKSNTYLLINFFFIPFLLIVLFHLLSYSPFIENCLYLVTNQFFYFSINYLDYYTVFYLFFKSDLSLLYEIYFLITIFEFIIINFVLLYSLFVIILFFYLIRKIFLFFLQNEIKICFNNKVFTNFTYIRQQDTIVQQRVISGINSWLKKNVK